MSEDNSFSDLLRRVRARDPAAAEELVRQYEPEIRRYVRYRLTDPRHRRLLDSIDICQSVLADFFIRAAIGQFDLESPRQLLGLLRTMARNKLLKRLQRLHPSSTADVENIADGAASPSQIIDPKDLLDKVLQRLTKEERYLADQWALRRSWAELAAELGDKPDALRKRLARALDRVKREPGLEDWNDE